MPVLSRRSILLLSGTALAAGALGTATPAIASSRPAAPAAIGLRSSFTALLGTTVTATRNRHSQRLTLLRVLDLPGAGDNDPHSFNLIFQTVGAEQLPEAVYRLSALRLAPVNLLLLPAGPAGAGQRLQAVVNRAPLNAAARNTGH